MTTDFARRVHPDYEKIERAIQFAVSNFRAQPTLEEMAAQVHTSPHHFQRVFTDWAGVSPKKFIQYLTVNALRDRLRNPTASSLETEAWKAGLSGGARLHDLFLKVEGMTPGQYRSEGAGLTLRYGLHQTPFGFAFLAITERGLCRLAFSDDLEAEVDYLRKRWPRSALLADPAQTEPWVERIFQPQPDRQLPLLLQGTPFQLQVWEALLRIPEGATATYRSIAEIVCTARASRAVGGAVGANPIAYLIPCHRVIQGTGALGGYHWGLKKKAAILGWECARTEPIRVAG